MAAMDAEYGGSAVVSTVLIVADVECVGEFSPARLGDVIEDPALIEVAVGFDGDVANVESLEYSPLTYRRLE